MLYVYICTHQYLPHRVSDGPYTAHSHVPAAVQVQLTADYAPSTLLDLLSSSQTVPLEAALAICEARGLVPEQVRDGRRQREYCGATVLYF